MGVSFASYCPNIVQFEFEMVKGASRNPGDLLCKAVKDFGIDKCVVGIGSKGGVGSFMMGGTASCVDFHLLELTIQKSAFQGQVRRNCSQTTLWRI